MIDMVTTTWKCRTDTLPAMYPCEKCQGLFTETIQRVNKNNQIVDLVTCIRCGHSFSKNSELKSCHASTYSHHVTKHDVAAYEKFGQDEIKNKLIHSIISRSNDTLGKELPQTGIVFLIMQPEKELKALLELNNYEFNNKLNEYYTISNNMSCNK